MNFIVYTHSDYKDIWPLYFGQMNKYFPEDKHYIIVDKWVAGIPINYEVILYDDKLTYRERMSSALKKINTVDYCIFQHEDMFLYDTPNHDKLKVFTEYLKANIEDKYFVKLIKGGITFGLSDATYPELKIITNKFDCVFAIQPTIWNFEKLREVYDNSKGRNVWEFEVDAKRVCIERKIFGYYIDDGGSSRKGTSHFDSSIYPYIATAVVKGKWNTDEYSNELKELFKKYGINPYTRGTNS